jgi:SAM-dependent methyltransferase
MMPDTQQFYDDLASYYHLIFEDWEASMARQGNVLDQLIAAELGQVQAGRVRVLDATCGIGTQTLSLAARGYQLVARDVSPAAVERLRREAQTRQLAVDAAAADMRQVASTVSGKFDVVLSFDNSLSHLLSDHDLLIALREFHRVLRTGGVFLCSVRDYDNVRRGEPATHAYGTRQYRGETFHLRQEWSWSDSKHYESTFIIEKETPNGLHRELCTVSPFYAVSTKTLLELMHKAGFEDCRLIDESIYQPILVGKSPG